MKWIFGGNFILGNPSTEHGLDLHIRVMEMYTVYTVFAYYILRAVINLCIAKTSPELLRSDLFIANSSQINCACQPLFERCKKEMILLGSI